MLSSRVHGFKNVKRRAQSTASRNLSSIRITHDEEDTPGEEDALDEEDASGEESI